MPVAFYAAWPRKTNLRGFTLSATCHAVAAAKADQLLRLLNHFLKLRPEHIHGAGVVRVAAEPDLEPLPLFALENEIS